MPVAAPRAGALRLPLIVAIIGGEPWRLRRLVDLYLETGTQHGYSAEQLMVASLPQV